MRVPALIAGPFLLLTIAACSDETPAAPSASSGPADAPAFSAQVPMRGSYEGSGVFTAPPASCGGFYSVFTGTGRESHVGRYSLHHTTCTVPIDATRSNFTGEFTKTAANGDLLFGTFEGNTSLAQAPGPGAPVGVFTIVGTVAFTGGTGRFDGATGGQRMEGTQWTDFSRDGFPSRMILEFDGTISPVGSR